MTTFVIRGVTLTEAGVKNYKQNYFGNDIIESLSDGFNTALKQIKQHKLSQREKSMLHKWLFDMNITRNNS